MLDALQNYRFKPIAREQQRDIAERVCSMRYEASHSKAKPYRKLIGCNIGAIGVVKYESVGLEHGCRHIEDIRAVPQDDFVLCLPLHARFHLSHAGRVTQIENGAALLLSTQHPFDAYINGTSADGRHSSLQVRIPSSLLRSRVPDVDQLCNRPFPVLFGAGRIMQSTLLASLEQGHALSEPQALRQSQVLADMVANSVLEFCGVAATAERRSLSGQAVFDRAMSFIECRLSSPALDASQIASHCYVSLRYLHKIFAQHGRTVSGSVRELRLHNCNASLCDVRLSHRSVLDIASHWGFNDPSHFARVYRKHFGVSPSQQRRRLFSTTGEVLN